MKKTETIHSVNLRPIFQTFFFQRSPHILKVAFSSFPSHLSQDELYIRGTWTPHNISCYTDVFHLMQWNLSRSICESLLNIFFFKFYFSNVHIHIWLCLHETLRWIVHYLYCFLPFSIMNNDAAVWIMWSCTYSYMDDMYIWELI